MRVRDVFASTDETTGAAGAAAGDVDGTTVTLCESSDSPIALDAVIVTV